MKDICNKMGLPSFFNNMYFSLIIIIMNDNLSFADLRESFLDLMYFFGYIFLYLLGIFAANLTQHAYCVPYMVPYRSDTTRSLVRVGHRFAYRSHSHMLAKVRVRAQSSMKTEMLLKEVERSEARNHCQLTLTSFRCASTCITGG